MSKKKQSKSVASEVETAKREFMRIRFRRVLGEAVPAHIIKNARKNIAKCVRLQNGENKGHV
ncbi:MAG: 50S ribosomal protein L29 [Holosporaceae bacterium]|jgi:ribosomal protein L29|nr:50S ribosomal protein L29 [Holosporaceae bacterium]